MKLGCFLLVEKPGKTEKRELERNRERKWRIVKKEMREN
jgi:hypothetical protein